MERKLLASSRFFSNVPKDIDELLQTRYSRFGSQKNFLVLKPTGTQETQDLGSEASEKSVKDKKLTHQPSSRAGKIDEAIDWSSLSRKYGNSRKIRRRLNKLDAKDQKSYKQKLMKNGIKDVQKKHLYLQQKKSRLTTRLAFRDYIRRCLKSQYFTSLKIKKLIGDCNNGPELSLASKELATNNKVIQYVDYYHLNKLWTGYIQDLLQTSRFGLDQNPASIMRKLVSAEYVGSILRVVKSTDANLLNLVGLVLHEYKNFFVVIVPNGLKYGSVSIEEQDNFLEKYRIGDLFDKSGCVFSSKELMGGIRMIEKKSCVFKVLIPFSEPDYETNNTETSDVNEVNGNNEKADNDGDENMKESNDNDKEIGKLRIEQDLVEFLIIGARFTVRSTERSNKKFKERDVKDLHKLLA